MRQRKIRLDPAHLRLRQPKQITHRRRLLTPPVNQTIIAMGIPLIGPEPSAVKPLTGRAFARLIEDCGWSLLRVNGSHHNYGRMGEAARLSVPIDGNKPRKVGLQRHLAKLAALTDADVI